MTSYVVLARVKKSWFKPAKIVFDVIELSQVWYDPSYGNGGGDYRPCEDRVATCTTEHEAELMCATLNKHKGEK